MIGPYAEPDVGLEPIHLTPAFKFAVRFCLFASASIPSYAAPVFVLLTWLQVIRVFSHCRSAVATGPGASCADIIASISQRCG